MASSRSEPGDMNTMDRVDVTATAELELVDQQSKLTVNISAQNLGPRDAYILHKLWVAELSGKRHWDPEVVYRFVDKGSLRLLFGPSPLASNMSVNNPQFPHATKLEPNQKLALSVALVAPIKEYSLFYPKEEGPAVTYTPTRVNRVDVLVQWAVLDEGVKANESFVDPQFFWMSVGRSQLHTSHTAVDVRGFDALRCDQFMTRPVAPGDERP